MKSRTEKKLHEKLRSQLYDSEPVDRISVQKLRDHGDLDWLDEDGDSLLSIAVARQNADAVALLLEYGAGPNRNAGGVVPWHLALELGGLEISALLVEFGANFHLKDKERRTGAEIARAFGHDSLASKFEEWENLLKREIPPAGGG